MSISDHQLTRPSTSTLRGALGPAARTLLDAAIGAADVAGAELWAVGGAVRDLAAGLPVRDVDVATSGDPAALATAVAASVGGTARIEPRFHTASVVTAEARLDIAALRAERYSRPGALPTVAPGASIEADLGRRDFSVNAVALRLVPRSARPVLVDPFGGLADLEARHLRVLHPRSFIDDPTRLWRAARYAARLGLRPDAATAALFEDGARHLGTISSARLWAEFERTAAEPRLGRTLALLDAWGALAGVDPAFRLTAETRRALARHRGPVGADLLLALLLGPLNPETQRTVAGRLGAPVAAKRAVDGATRLLAAADADPTALEALRDTGPSARTAARWLGGAEQAALQRALTRWERTASPLAASEVIALGVPAGPGLGAMLDRLRRARYLGTLTGVASARREVRRWLAEESKTR